MLGLLLAVGEGGQLGRAEVRPESEPRSRLDLLIRAYPDHLDRIDGADLVWKDGTRMRVDDGRPAKEFAALLDVPDIKDMLAMPYPAGAGTAPPVRNADPGRVRHAAFFDKMYGNCRTGEVEKHLVDVVWLPRKWGRTLKVTRINGVAGKLAAISRELDQLPARFDQFLAPAAGAFNCRPIAGTTRASSHGHGIAVDIAAQHAHYWRWTKPGPDGALVYRNRVPPEIVEVFERHGFIWGGKWHHYDTMHFEYRPELLGGR